MATSGLYLQWEGKRRYRQAVPRPRVLEPVPDLSYGEDGGNMVIEGDNLQVLASLASRYAGQVDVVYIDPPYNMGKEDFRYSDKRFHDPDADDSDAVYVTNEDGGKHTKWLNFLAPRLYKLWQMLNDDRGVIFVSINDVELFRLGMLMNEVFGEDNWIGTLVWKSITDNNPTRIAVEHEYILCYAKNKAKLPSEWSSPEGEAKELLMAEYQRLKDEHGDDLKAITRAFQAFAKEHKDYLGDLYRYRQVDAHGPYGARRNVENPGKPGHYYDVPYKGSGLPVAKPKWGWRFKEETFQNLIARDRIIWGKDHTQQPQLKVYLEEVAFALRSVIDIYSGNGSNDLEKLFGARDVFKNPKPVELIEKLLGYTTRPDSLVLDAFAGSGSTAEAVLKLNARDGGCRRFILIEEGKPKDRFARTLTGERIKRAVETHGYRGGYTFYAAGRKIDRAAIVDMERDAMAALICQADETGRGRGIKRLTGYKYVIGANARGEAICLNWSGSLDSEVTREVLSAAAEEVAAAGLKKPFRIYGTVCRFGETPSFKFCQIPDEILAQMHITDDGSEIDD